MKDIYEIFESRKEILIDEEYYNIQEGYDELIILEKETCVTLEELVYNNPEKKKLSILMEEVEESNVKKSTNIIEKLKEQMKKVLNWLMSMFNHYEKAFEEGANFVKNNDLNAHMSKIKARGVIVPVNCHPNKVPFRQMKVTCLREIKLEKWIAKLNGGADAKFAEAGEIEIKSGDKTDTYLEALLKKFSMSKEHLKEVHLSSLNVVLISNNLLELPNANKELQKLKDKMQRLYNQLINKVRSEHARDKTEKQVQYGSNQISHINGQLKIINERIRAYSKVMTLVFKEDYNLAKLIVAKSSKSSTPTKEGK